MNSRRHPLSLSLAEFAAAALLVAAGLGGRLALLRAQTPAPAGSGDAAATFHAGTQEVLVDVAVADKKGNVPRDLTPRDFRILEDGKEQEITTFSLDSMGGSGRSRRLLALLFEMDNPKFRDDAVRFVDGFASPDLYIAVYARENKKIRLLQGFTADPARIKAALGSMQVIPLKEDFEEESRHSTHLAGIGELAATLAPIRGRKALIELGWNFTNVRNRTVEGTGTPMGYGSSPSGRRPFSPGSPGRPMPVIRPTSRCTHSMPLPGSAVSATTLTARRDRRTITARF